MIETIRVLPWGDFDENTYVVGDQKECIIFDPGAPAAPIAKLIEGRKVAGIYLTHTHLDHIMGVDELRDATGARVFVPINERTGLEDPMINLSAYYGQEIRRRPADETIAGGDEISAGTIRLKVRDLPGHAPGHLVFVAAGSSKTPGFVIAGDTLFAGSIGRTDFPGASHTLLIEGIRRELLSLPDETSVHPGHGPKTSIGAERRYNPFLVR